jgi:hydrogenase maturation protein HypF
VIHPLPSSPLPISDAPAAVEIVVRGVVQGVGFRPFVHRLALRHGIRGWVRNESGSVRILAEATGAELRGFLSDIQAQAPPLARIDDVETRPAETEDCPDFRVVVSETEASGRLPVAPDVALCEVCAGELHDPRNRRYRYPFITCTDCGPRFTVIETMPYDRERTTMRSFHQCPRCLSEYRDPRDRRYHSETNSCPDCGPKVWLERDGAEAGYGEGAILAAARMLVQGRVLAIRGLGGFHLACDARADLAVRRLRRRKERDAKPLAVMVASIEDVRSLAVTTPREEELLLSRERPIVVLERRPGSGLAPSVAPGLSTVGVMVAYTPLHLLLLGEVGGPLVMTSGNRSEEPIATGNDEARARLASVADGFLLHDREIVARYDDSLVRVADSGALFLRRARGYAPLPVPLPIPAPQPILAVGPHLKNTLTLAEGSDGWVSQHVGDLENLETLDHFQDVLDRFESVFRVRPDFVVRDLHPGYLSTRVAEETGLPELPPVQHHHGHIAAVQGEHGVREQVLGLAFDGTGYGEDGKVWGAEFLLSDLTGYRRLGRLRYAPLPGGDAAARAPWRAALGYLSLEPDTAPSFAAAFAGVDPVERRTADLQVRRRVNAPLASSMGRLFDAAAAVLGIRTVSRFEGQAPMELESLAGRRPGDPLPWSAFEDAEGCRVLDPLPLLDALGSLRRRGVPVEDLAARFHETVAEATATLALRMADETGVGTVALGGGCFQNVRLLDGVARRLRDADLKVLLPRRLGPNDGAVSYGQAVVAAARLREWGDAAIVTAGQHDRASGFSAGLSTLPRGKE